MTAAPELAAVVFPVADPAVAANFWAALLERKAVGAPEGFLLEGTAAQIGLKFVKGSARGSGTNLIHLHLTSDAAMTQQEFVDLALSLGASHLDVGQLPEEGHIVLADPQGNEFCIIERGNKYLAGCGVLGELACDGTRTDGVFWRNILQWSLVWDQEEETAIQSPAGGTKIGWGGPPLISEPAPNMQFFELSCPARSREAVEAKLVTAGARKVASDHITGPESQWQDPDARPFVLVSDER